MQKTLLLTAFFLVMALSLHAQNPQTGTMSGTILDRQGSPVPGTTVQILNATLGAVANADGRYEIRQVPLGKQKVKVTSLGYASQTKEVTVSASTTLNFTLSEDAVQHGEVVVTAKSSVQKAREEPQAITVIDAKDIQGRAVTIESILNKAVGVKIRQSGGEGSTSRLSVRGLEGKRIGFFIDEVPLSDNSEFIDVNDIPVDLIDRIEVYKGVVPAKFGGSAVGGAVNIVLKEYPPTYIDISYARQSFNTNKVSVVIKKNNPESGYEFGGGGFYTYADNDYTMDSPYEPGLKIRRDHDLFEKKAFALSLVSKKWWFDEVEFEPVFLQTKKEIQGIRQNIQEAFTNAEAYVIANHLEKEHFLTDGLEFDFNIAYAYTIFKFEDKAMRRYNWDGTTYAPVSPLGGEIGTTPNDAENKKHTVLQKTNLNYTLNPISSFNFNSVYTYACNRPKDELQDAVIGYKTNYNSTMNSWVGGLSYQFRTADDVFLNDLTGKYYFYSINTTMVEFMGINAPEKVDMSKSDFGFNNSLRYRFTPDFLIKASYAYDVRLPSEEELLGDGYLTVPAGNLKPERNSSINLGVMYDRRISGNRRLQIEFNVFYMYLKDMIRFTAGVLQSQYQNFGEMRTLGADFEIKYDLTDYLYVHGNATYQDLRDTRETEPGSSYPNPTEGDRMPNVPYFYANAGTEFHMENLFGGHGQNTRIFLESSFVEEFFYDFEQSAFQERRIPRSLSFDAGFEHSFYDNSLFIGLQVNNLTDETLLSEYNQPLPGRTIGLKLRYIFR